MNLFYEKIYRFGPVFTHPDLHFGDFLRRMTRCVSQSIQMHETKSLVIMFSTHTSAVAGGAICGGGGAIALLGGAITH